MTTWYVISSQGRTGTHMLVTSLDSHPHIKSTGEMFNSLKRLGRSRSRTPANIWSNGGKGWRGRGGRFAIHHHELCQPPVAEAILPNRPRVILLHRLDFLRRLCSELVALADQGVEPGRGPAAPSRP